MRRDANLTKPLPEMMHEERGGTQNYLIEDWLLSGVVTVAGLDEETFLMKREVDLVVAV
jgi:hypothetical protein